MARKSLAESTLQISGKAEFEKTNLLHSIGSREFTSLPINDYAISRKPWGCFGKATDALITHSF
jgi:hypothetical protein